MLLYHDQDTSSAYHSWWEDRPLLTRAGGYWWDGASWYRPPQVIDRAAEGHARRRVPHPTTLTATDVLDTTSTPSSGQVHKVAAFAPYTVSDPQWRNDLATWAEQQKTRSDALPLERCVIRINAPELSELLGIEDIAGQTGESASKLREDFDRGFSEALPTPQAIIDGHPWWSRTVVQDWQEERRRGHPEDLLNSGPSPAVSRLWARLTTTFTEDLAHRSSTGGIVERVLHAVSGPAAQRDTAEDLAWTGALNAETMLPPSASRGSAAASNWAAARCQAARASSAAPLASSACPRESSTSAAPHSSWSCSRSFNARSKQITARAGSPQGESAAAVKRSL